MNERTFDNDISVLRFWGNPCIFRGDRIRHTDALDKTVAENKPESRKKQDGDKGGRKAGKGSTREESEDLVTGKFAV
jgi:hypothetical protein